MPRLAVTMILATGCLSVPGPLDSDGGLSDGGSYDTLLDDFNRNDSDAVDGWTEDGNSAEDNFFISGNKLQWMGAGTGGGDDQSYGTLWLDMPLEGLDHWACFEITVPVPAPPAFEMNLGVAFRGGPSQDYISVYGATDDPVDDTPPWFGTIYGDGIDYQPLDEGSDCDQLINVNGDDHKVFCASLTGPTESPVGTAWNLVDDPGSDPSTFPPASCTWEASVEPEETPNKRQIGIHVWSLSGEGTLLLDNFRTGSL